MTTIVYDHKNKQIACDSRISKGSMISTDSAIKYRLKGDQLWFFTGSVSDNNELMELAHNDKPAVEPDCCAFVVIDGNCHLVTFNNGYCTYTKLEWGDAIGSGSSFALSAIDHDKTAKEAVKYAMTRDCYSGGKIHVYDIEAAEFI